MYIYIYIYVYIYVYNNLHAIRFMHILTVQAMPGPAAAVLLHCFAERIQLPHGQTNATEVQEASEVRPSGRHRKTMDVFFMGI